MADTTYTSGVTVISADTMNDLNRLHYTIFADPADIAAVRTALSLVPGTYTPTAANADGIIVTAATPAIHFYLRAGDVVFVFGRCGVTATASAAEGEFTITLPVASNLATVQDLSGSGSNVILDNVNFPYPTVAIIGDATNNVAKIKVMGSAATTAFNIVYSFGYRIL